MKRRIDLSDRASKLRKFQVAKGLPDTEAIIEELKDMLNVLLGRTAPPIDAGIMTMMEVADAYYARASELSLLILEGERTGTIPKSSDYSKIRTGELRTFLEACKKCTDLGSRRLTLAQHEVYALHRNLSPEMLDDDE